MNVVVVSMVKIRQMNHQKAVRNGLLPACAKCDFFYLFLFMHFCPGTMTTHAESINSDLQRGLERRLRHTQQNHLAKVSADN